MPITNEDIYRSNGVEEQAYVPPRVINLMDNYNKIKNEGKHFIITYGKDFFKVERICYKVPGSLMWPCELPATDDKIVLRNRLEEWIGANLQGSNDRSLPDNDVRMG
jgi:hypothetical protein